MSVQRKANLSSFDVAQLVQELNSTILTTRVNAFVNTTKDSFMMRTATSAMALEKFQIPFQQHEHLQKFKLLIFPGVRANLTQFDQPVAPPTQFTKFVREKLEDQLILAVQQLNFDRVIIMGFGKQEIQYYLIVELFGKGNVLLTDQNYTILALLNQLKGVRVQTSYFTNQQTPMTLQQIELKLSKEAFMKCISDSFQAKGQQCQLRYVLAKEFFIGGPAASVIVRFCKLAPGVKTKNMTEQQTEEAYLYMSKLLSSLIANFKQSKLQFMPGYCFFYTQNEVQIDKDIVDQKVVRSLQLAEFCPVNLLECFPGLYQEDQVEKFINFNETIDNYFSMLETCQQHQSNVQQIVKQESKTNSIGSENDKRIQQLEKEAMILQLKGKMVWYYQDFIEKYLQLLNRQFSTNNVTWSTIGDQMQTQADPLYQFLDSVDLIQRQFTLRLVLKPEMHVDLGYESFEEILKLFTDENDEEIDNESIISLESDQVILIQFTLQDTVGKLVNQLFSKSTQLLQKAGKTLQQSNQALEKLSQQPKQIQQQELKILQKQQNLNWFEKFHWFVSSDGFLVVGGRDAQQNEILVKRFMQDNDLFMHADIHGASCVVIKNKKFLCEKEEFYPRVPPQQTLLEAAQLSIVHSKTWESKLIPQAYWVFKQQVSKKAQTGEYVGTGSFVIRGSKNYVKIDQLKMGAVLLWRYVEQRSLFTLQKSEQFDEYLQQQLKLTKTELKLNLDEAANTKMTTKKKVGEVKAANFKSEAFKQKRKDEKKERQAKIKEQKQKAKMKRLEAEGKTDIIEKIQQNKEIVEQVSTNFCVICQGQHCIGECDKYEEHFEFLNQRLPPILAQFKQQQVEQLEESEKEEEQPEQEVEEQVKIIEDLSKPIYYIDQILQKELEPQPIVMIAPISALNKFNFVVQITDGKIQRGQSYSQLMQIFNKRFTDSYVQQQIKNIPDHTVLLAIPGSCQFVWEKEKK
uniref:NFACT RNA-binding domain-containing protein n=1 Tax=Trepomonas sp. PC1 TaxID=1076344 RepID=A0A146K8Y1_9EUKA|eukprot:JAP91981.1 Hypothetical protein TPC1_16223 [Trepomonas sp. PC1]